MAKFKPARAKPTPPPKPGAVPCLILLLSGLILLTLLFWAVLSSFSK